MPETTTGPHCHYCNAGRKTTHLTLAGLRTQARDFRLFLQATCASAAGRTPAARQHGGLLSLKLAATVESAGWRR